MKPPRANGDDAGGWRAKAASHMRRRRRGRLEWQTERREQRIRSTERRMQTSAALLMDEQKERMQEDGEGKGAGDEEKRQPQLLVAGKTQAVDGIMERKAVWHATVRRGSQETRSGCETRPHLSMTGSIQRRRRRYQKSSLLVTTGARCSSRSGLTTASVPCRKEALRAWALELDSTMPNAAD